MQFLGFLGDNIIYFMFGLLLFSLLFRWLSYKSCSYDYIYYSTFTKEIGKALINLESEKEQNEDLTPGEHLTQLLDIVASE